MKIRWLKLLKGMFLDLVSMGKGFIYGFVLVGLLILICDALLDGILLLKKSLIF